MKKSILLITGISVIGFSAVCYAAQGVAIQRVITNTRSELGQLASSSKAQKIAELMKKFGNEQTKMVSCILTPIRYTFPRRSVGTRKKKS